MFRYKTNLQQPARLQQQALLTQSACSAAAAAAANVNRDNVARCSLYLLHKGCMWCKSCHPLQA